VLGEEIGDLIRTARELGEGHDVITAGIVHHPQCRPLVAGRDPVEVIERPVEMRDGRPVKCPQSLGVRDVLAQQPIAQFDECIAALHETPRSPS
jgi:hypothetical protein